MHDGEDADGVRLFLIENDMCAMFVAANASGDDVRLSPHSRIFGQQGEDALKLFEIANGLLPPEAFQPKHIDIEQIVVGARAGEVISHA